MARGRGRGPTPSETGFAGPAATGRDGVRLCSTPLSGTFFGLPRVRVPSSGPTNIAVQSALIQDLSAARVSSILGLSARWTAPSRSPESVPERGGEGLCAFDPLTMANGSSLITRVETATILAGNRSFVITGVGTTSCGRRLVAWSRDDALFRCSRSGLQEEMV
jgi:hypothetical protein